METIAFICALALFFKGVFGDEVKSVSLMEGDSLTLHTDTKIQKDDLIEWRFGDKGDLIARINRVNNSLETHDEICDDVLDGRFRDRLQVNNQTGDLTITNITTQHTGVYEVEISRETATIKKFSVYVSVDTDKVKTVMVGDSVIQHNNVTKKPGDEKIVWRIRHNNSPVAEIIRNGKETHDKVHDVRFRDRLQVDDQTGDLNITNITPEDFGSYEVNITVGNNSYTIHRSFSVNVNGVDPQKERHESNKDQDQSSGSKPLTTEQIVGIVVVGVLVAVAVAVAAVAAVFFIYRKRSRTASTDKKSPETFPLRTVSSSKSLYCDQHSTGFSMGH